VPEKLIGELSKMMSKKYLKKNLRRPNNLKKKKKKTIQSPFQSSKSKD
jgi:hypothetical protein